MPEQSSKSGAVSEGPVDLADLKREVIESRNLVIKTDNLLRSLHAEVKAVGKRQEEYEKRQWISSGAAYLVIALVSVGAAWSITATRSSSAREEHDRLSGSLAELKAQSDKQKSDLGAANNASRAAAEVYQMMTTLPGEQRFKGVEILARIDQNKLTPLERRVLQEKAEELRKEVGQATFERGKAAYRRNDMPAVVQELGRFMTLAPSAEDALDASFYMGAAYNQLKKHDQAVPLLARFVNEDRKAKTRDYAMMLLAHSYDQTGQEEKAAEVARDALATYPASPFQGELRLRLSAAKKALAKVEEGAASPPAQGTVATPAPKPATPPPGATPTTDGPPRASAPATPAPPAAPVPPAAKP